ncbi:Zn-ribbon domain-containing OB-fold protein [Roseomonas sp. USHLN139]|uniref:Zn-ribbon domain-containing OB-fold protein n=1 Tax=Roseomonas sp. USHLN139 TaxID=3081298 RepID=UPI003B01ACB1
MTETRIPPAPTPDPSTQAFWDAAREGKLLLGRNTKTGKLHYPPRPVCPFDDEGEVELVPAKGAGTIYSFSIMRAKVPYAIAYVELEEGPRMMTNIIGAAFDSIRIGQKVTLQFQPTDGDGPPVPMFTPA